ncbi:helix-turn-helix transcriptional regulator [Actinotalea solisilvae]|uniref:helix-turn-helix transcriptional regulator n=1 Tax=Actinotalea solisilvae TaxID=2072922 RepID=UPI0027DC7D1A|nr:LuxR C-terminal-related transcriptional regulator [Actinotalea solisilvae]
MTVEHVRTPPANRPALRRPVQGEPGPTYPPSPRPAPGGPLCLVVPEIGDGDGHMLVRSLRRRESTRAVLLTRKAGRRELVVLLGGGVRGAVTAENPGAVRIAAKPVPVAAKPGPELTARELGVLRHVADGRSNRQIGEALELSALTVKSHLARISRKVGTGDRAEMVAYAIRHELLG